MIGDISNEMRGVTILYQQIAKICMDDPGKVDLRANHWLSNQLFHYKYNTAVNLFTERYKLASPLFPSI